MNGGIFLVTLMIIFKSILCRFIVGGRSDATKQLIVMETCLGQVVDRPCDVDTNTHQTVCRQKYANHR